MTSDRQRGAGFGLAAKITAPFVALFAALLLVLGVVLAREILAEVEAQVEREQRFVLEVASWATFAFDESKLREIRSLAAQTFSELVVTQEGGRTQTTLPRAQPDRLGLLENFEALLLARGDLRQRDESIQRYDAVMSGQRFWVLHRVRASVGQPPRHYYLLYPYAEIDRAKNRSLWRIIGLGSLGLLLAAALGLGVARWISRPVRRLAAAAKRISAGGLNEPFDPVPAGAHRDEIAELAQAFQAMVESLRASQRELLQSERLAAIGKLAASVAHEIRNPLTSLRMTLQVLQQRPENAGAGTQQAYRILLGEIDRLSLSVEELLTFAHPRPPQRQPADINALVAETLALLERQLSHAHVKGVAELDPAMPKDVLLDPNKIRQLLMNLLINAQQAIVRGGQITVRTGWDASLRQIRLQVADTGPGIPEAIRGSLFELFVTTKAGGGGLGLAIARQIAEEHGGAIAFETSAQGTVFTVTLPQI